jgi:hypothetical protein
MPLLRGALTVNGDAGTTGKDHVDAMTVKMGADEGSQLAEVHIPNRLHSGLPGLRGRQRHKAGPGPCLERCEGLPLVLGLVLPSPDVGHQTDQAGT